MDDYFHLMIFWKPWSRSGFDSRISSSIARACKI